MNTTTIDRIFNIFMKVIEENEINDSNIFENSYNTSKILTMLKFQYNNIFNVKTKLTIHELNPILYLSNHIIKCKLIFTKISDKQIKCFVYECFGNEIVNNILCHEILFSNEDKCEILKLNFIKINFSIINLLNEILPKLYIYIKPA